jgi:hypothetical protein
VVSLRRECGAKSVRESRLHRSSGHRVRVGVVESHNTRCLARVHLAIDIIDIYPTHHRASRLAGEFPEHYWLSLVGSSINTSKRGLTAAEIVQLVFCFLLRLQAMPTIHSTSNE